MEGAVSRVGEKVAEYPSGPKRQNEHIEVNFTDKRFLPKGNMGPGDGPMGPRTALLCCKEAGFNTEP